MSKLNLASSFENNDFETIYSKSDIRDIRIKNGVVEIGGLALFPKRNYSKRNKISKPLNSLSRSLVISHIFLSVMVSIILFAPKQVIKLKSVLKYSYSFVKSVVKRIFDIFGAMVGLMVSSLLFLLLPILIRLDSQGDVIFRQRRVGLNRRNKDRRVVSLEVEVDRRQGSRRKEDLLGKPFVLYKFRSMKGDAEKKTGPVWASENDPRVTSVGKILRPLHMDEIPQFVNVLRGEMSLVGPRPERPEFVKQLNEQVPEYSERFKGKPGITGLAQVKCGYDATIDDVNKKLRFDLEYIKTFQLRRDFKILWETFLKIIQKKSIENSVTAKNEENIESSNGVYENANINTQKEEVTA